jgi:hypothetical protein
MQLTRITTQILVQSLMYPSSRSEIMLSDFSIHGMKLLTEVLIFGGHQYTRLK